MTNNLTIIFTLKQSKINLDKYFLNVNIFKGSEVSIYNHIFANENTYEEIKELMDAFIKIFGR